MRAIALTVVCLLCVSSGTPAFASSFASQVVSYTAGTNATPGYTDPNVALGSPGRSTGSGPFDGDVTPFNAPYAASDVVSIGAGGSLTVRFDHPVADDATNPYGIDLLVFGNAFLGIDVATFTTATGTLEVLEPANVEVSQDGVTWFLVPGVLADAQPFPTLGYQDPPGPFDSGGTIPTSFTRPVDPALTVASFAGMTTAQIAAAYGGSGGGTGIDLAPLGLPWIEYVRVSQESGPAADIDAFADVPEPAGVALFGVALLGLTSSRARRSRPNRAAGACAGAR
jgi:hypothetical protein